MKRINTVSQAIYFSFPVQLFILLFKKNQLLLLYWACIIGIVTGNLGTKFGLQYLFLDPEYLGVVGFRSMFILGAGIGGFIMSFTISSYILNGFRFPFLAALSRPFQKYFFNNFPVPLLFLSIYLYEFVHFQLYSEFQSQVLIMKEVGGFILGTGVTILLTLTYFFKTDKDIFKATGIQQPELPDKHSITRTKPHHTKKMVKKNPKEWRVDSYLVHIFRARLTRGTEHYEKETLEVISRRNHIHAALAELFVFILILILGLFRENRLFRIPAGASVLLLFSMIVMLTSAYRFWLRGWSTTIAICVIVFMNILSQNSIFSTRNQAYGLNYKGTYPKYNLENLKYFCTKDNCSSDELSTLAILEKWKIKNQLFAAADSNPSKREKPKMIFICTSGGGLRAAMWTLRTLQVADSSTHGHLFKATQLMTGASGGSIGSAYFRELYLRKYSEENSKKSAKEILDSLHSFTLYNDVFLDNISRDLLNPIALSIAVNDMFLSFQKFSDGKQSYKKDRAFEFEKQLNENTNHILDKKLSDYKKPEEEAIIPMMVFNPTIVNDGRLLFISSQPVSYLTGQNAPSKNNRIIEGVEYSRLFLDQDAANTKFTSVLRMNATFPYIMPTVSLPSDPPLDIMDAGMRDNFGLQSALSFLYIFRKWISENTSGVMIVQIRDTHKEKQMERKPKTSLLSSLVTPLENFYTNFSKIQDYNQDELVEYASSWYGGKIDFALFQLPEEKHQVSLSWHLTTREKQYIYSAIDNAENQEALYKVKKFLE